MANAPQRTLPCGWQMSAFSLQLIAFKQSQILIFETLPKKDFKALMFQETARLPVTASCYHPLKHLGKLRMEIQIEGCEEERKQVFIEAPAVTQDLQ